MSNASRRALVALASTAALALPGCVPRDGAGSTTARDDPAAGPGASAPEGDEAPPRPIPASLLAELVAEAERVRELRAVRPIEGVAMSEAQIRAHIRAEVSETDTRVAEQIMRAFGFLPEGAGPLDDLLVQLLGEEVLGLYDPEEDRLMVRSDVALELGSNGLAAAEARGVLVHEVVHALQDQHFETLGLTSDDAWADDELSALDCLAEGDATLAMMVVMMESAGADPSVTLSPEFGSMIRRLGQAALPESEAMRQAPPYFGFVLGGTYFEGAAFAADLRRRGGWAAVDEAHRSPPAGTMHVLHPELYASGLTPIRIDLPGELPGLGGPDWRLVRSAVLGELETAAFLLPVGDQVLASQGAEGWLGDRFAVFEGPGGGLALAWRLRFTSEAEASEFLVVARDATVATGRGPCEEPPAPPAGPRAIACSRRADLLAQSGADVAVARGVPPEQAAAIVATLLVAPVAEPTPALPDQGRP